MRIYTAHGFLVLPHFLAPTEAPALLVGQRCILGTLSTGIAQCVLCSKTKDPRVDPRGDSHSTAWGPTEKQQHFFTQILQYTFAAFGYWLLLRTVPFFWNEVFIFSHKIWLQSPKEKRTIKSHHPQNEHHFANLHIIMQNYSFLCQRLPDTHSRRGIRVDLNFTYKNS